MALSPADVRRAFFSRAEAQRALRVLDAALETEEGWEFARASGAVAQLYAAVLILDDYLTNSRWVSPVREPTSADHRLAYYEIPQ